jgi:WD40 repeat protein
MDTQNSLREGLLTYDSKLTRQSMKLQIAQELDVIVSEMREIDLPNCKIASHSNSLLSLIFCQNTGRLYTGAAEKKIMIWETADPKLISALALKKNLLCLCLAKEGRLIIAAAGKQISVFSGETWALLFDLNGHEDCVTSLVLSKDEKFLISGSKDKTVVIWNLENKKIETLLKGHEKPINCLAITRDGKFLITAGEDKKVFAWNQAKYTTECEVNFKCKIFSIAAVSKNFVAIGLEDGKITVWNIIERKEEFKLLGHSLYITHLSVSDDGETLISSSGDSTVKFWNINKKRSEFSIKTKEIVKRLAVDKNLSVLYTGSDKGEVHQWLIESKIGQNLLPHSEISYRALITSANKYIISTSDRNKIHVWSCETKNYCFSLEGHNDLVYSMDCSSDECLLASSGSDKCIKVWDLNERTCIFELVGHTKQVLCVKFSNDQKYLVSSSRDKTIKLWDIQTRTKVLELLGHEDLVHSLIFVQNDTHIVSGSFDSKIRMWNIQSTSLIHTFEGHSQYIMELDCSGDHLVSVSGDKTAKVWSLSEKSELFTLMGHEEPIWSVSISGDDIATGSVDCSIRIWSLSERREKFKLIGHSGCVTVCRLSTDGKTLVSASFDETIRVWNIGETEELLNPFPFQSKKDFMSMISYFRESRAPLHGHKNLLISKSKYCLMHIFAHLAKHEMLAELLRLNPLFFNDKFGNSAFFYAIKKKSLACTELLLKFIIDMKKGPKVTLELSLQAIRNEFEMIIKTSSKLLPTFIDLLLISRVKTYGVPFGELPLLAITEKSKPDLASFFANSEGIDKNIYLKIRSSAMNFTFAAGSDASLRFLTRLIGNGRTLIFKTQLIRGLVKVKWNQMRSLIFFSAFLLWANLVAMVMLVCYQEKGTALLGIYAGINGILLLFQIIVLVRKGFRGFLASSGNIVEVFRIFLVVTWIWLQFDQGKDYDEVTWIMILFNFARGLTGFRAFSFTRFYTRLIISALNDIFSFFLIFCYAIVACGVLLTFKDYDKSIYRIWEFSFDLSLGIFTSDKEDLLQYVSFIFASIFNMVIMLSLLISILSDSFDKFQNESTDIDYKEMAQEILNMEFLLICRKRNVQKMFLHVCDTKKLFDDGKEWEGKIKMIEKHNIEALGGIKQTNNYIIEKVKTIEKENNQHYFDLQKKIDLNHLKLEKLEKKILASIEEMKVKKKRKD